jgi:hypothetical protein
MYKIVIKTFGFLYYFYFKKSPFCSFFYEKRLKNCLLFLAFGAKRHIYI